MIVATSSVDGLVTLNKRLYRGKKRYAKRLYPGRSEQLLLWALSVKPGDYIATCEGCNRQVVSKEIDRANEGHWNRNRPNKTSVIHEVVFTDTRGRWHYCPGGGCAYPAETPEQVTQYFREYILHPEAESEIRTWYGKDTDSINKALERHHRFKDALLTGRPIVDAHGELLSEFDTPLSVEVAV